MPVENLLQQSRVKLKKRILIEMGMHSKEKISKSEYDSLKTECPDLLEIDGYSHYKYCLSDVTDAEFDELCRLREITRNEESTKYLKKISTMAVFWTIVGSIILAIILIYILFLIL